MKGYQTVMARGGTFIPGPRPTQLDVARRAGVSRALVSLVMRGSTHVAPDSRARVLAAAEELGYRPNAYARTLAGRQNRTIGVLINDVSNPYFGGMYASLAGEAERAGLDLLVAPGWREAAREGALLDTLLEHQVAGLLLLSPTMRESRLQAYCTASPTVVIGREISFSGVDVVTIDETLSARLVVDHLVALGHERIAHISGGSDNRPALDRAAAYRLAMRERGFAPFVIPGYFAPEGGREGAQALLERDELPTAIFAANDLVAVGAIGHLRSVGVRVPQDISVVGYDDSQIASLDIVGLTSVRQPLERFGELAIELLLERMAGRRQGSRIERIPPELVVRATTAGAP
jgi:DNA-binding LacI/PurR family transcriptional regulator